MSVITYVSLKWDEHSPSAGCDSPLLRDGVFLWPTLPYGLPPGREAERVGLPTDLLMSFLMVNPVPSLLTDDAFLSLSTSERRLYIQRSWVGQTEVGGNNHGPLPEACLASVGLGAGAPWCAAAQYRACLLAGIDPTKLRARREAAAVYGWVEWARREQRLLTSPRRGCLFFWLHSAGAWSMGHMGSVADVYPGGALRTFEGNTSSGEHGSQRDGDGFWERRPGFSPRTLSFIHQFPVSGFIDLTNLTQ